MIVNMTGAGGGGLNIKVVAYASVPTLAAAENTIGVVTDTAISGWVMQAEQPTGVEGMVWIEVAAASDVAFYADKKQRVKVYPASVMQLQADGWTSVDAYIYQGGKWVSFSSAFDGWLYYQGETYDRITGGWTNATGTLTQNSDSMYVLNGRATTAKKINTKGFSTLEMVVKTASAQPSYIGIGETTDAFVAQTSISKTVSAYTAYTLSLADTQGEYFVMFSTNATNSGLYVNSIRLY